LSNFAHKTTKISRAKPENLEQTMLF
jgi:hypothetical protein